MLEISAASLAGGFATHQVFCCCHTQNYLKKNKKGEKYREGKPGDAMFSMETTCARASIGAPPAQIQSGNQNSSIKI